jgi:hypothetical protein
MEDVNRHDVEDMRSYARVADNTRSVRWLCITITDTFDYSTSSKINMIRVKNTCFILTKLPITHQIINKPSIRVIRSSESALETSAHFMPRTRVKDALMW